MRKTNNMIIVTMAGAFMAWCLSGIPWAFADTTVTLERPVHFTNAEGSDVVLNAGEYAIEPTEEWLRVTPVEGQARDSLLLEATTGDHEESLTAPLALSAKSEQPDTHHVALLLPDGKRLEAIGSYSGVRSKGTPSLLSIQRLRILSSSSPTATPTEFSAPLFWREWGQHFI